MTNILELAHRAQIAMQPPVHDRGEHDVRPADYERYLICCAADVITHSSNLGLIKGPAHTVYQ